MNEYNVVFPHQLFEESPLLKMNGVFVLIELDLFFTQFRFHLSKLAFQRASMRFYKSFLEKNGKEVIYIEASSKESSIEGLVKDLNKRKTNLIRFIDPVDDWVESRLRRHAEDHGIDTEIIETPHFINTRNDLSGFFRKDKKKFYQTSFYKSERQRLNILIGADGKPTGGKWTFDTENRKRYPKDKEPPAYSVQFDQKEFDSAVDYIAKNYEFLGAKSDIENLIPFDHEGAKAHLISFLDERFRNFGVYEDAIVRDETVLNHSLLSPLINSGLITPEEVVETTLQFASDNDIPINSLEGFLRQVIGWRDFISGVYIAKGRQQRTTNYWGFSRQIPASFYEGTTGIEPVDKTIRKLLKTGYCHHIERLMILGNFMLLCEFDPDEVYRWFMEFFIDSYDWVMVPNVYGMSQFADGGLMTTKPYISGSNYILKMSDYEPGEWTEIWDGLFWRFLSEKKEFFSKNPRMRMLVSNWDRMSAEKRSKHIQAAEEFLDQLS